MNSKRKATTSLHGNTTILDISATPKCEPVKHNLLTSCRRMGLNRKRNKSLGVSSILTKANQNINVFVDEDLKEINEATNLSPNVNSSTVVNNVPTSFTSKEDSDDKPKFNLRKKKFISQRKSKIVCDGDHAIINDLSSNSSRTDSPVLSIKKIKRISDAHKSKNESLNLNVHTIPVSINLTRCDLNALKLKLSSPQNIQMDTSENVHQENKENQPKIQNKKAGVINLDKELNKESTEQSDLGLVIDKENLKEYEEKQLETIKELSPVFKSINNVPVENNSLEDNSDGSDFYPDVIRRKKKKVLTNKQRNISKPGPSQQKENIIVNKRISVNNTPCYSDSDDDFVTNPVRRDRKSSVKSENNSQSSVKEESGKSTKKKLKLKKPVEDELNKTDLMNNIDSLAQEFQTKPVQEENQTTNKEMQTTNKKEMPKSQEKVCVFETIRLLNDNSNLELQKNDMNVPVQEKINSNKSDNGDSSSETSVSDNNDSETSDSDSKNSGSASPLEGHETSDLNIKHLTEELTTLEANIKKKQDRLQSLQRISVYKETHNLEQLSDVTLQIKRGCQNALIDLVLSVKQQSNADFTMATLLEYMKIPYELVGYNEEEDKFT